MVERKTRARRRVQRGEQLELPLKRARDGTRRGGARVGAGRKRVSARASTPHRARPPHRATEPVHVTLRARFGPQRSQFLFPTIQIAITRVNLRDSETFRVVQYSVQGDHLHMLVEASTRRALSSGMRSVAIRIARYVNELLGRKGRFWSDRWHGRALHSPREVRHALVYVLANFRKHVPVSKMCSLLGVTRSGFYAWAKRPKPARAKSDAQLAATVAAVHQRSRKTYGSPRVHRELRAHGMRVGKKRVERLMRENGIRRRNNGVSRARPTPSTADRSRPTCSLARSA